MRATLQGRPKRRSLRCLAPFAFCLLAGAQVAFAAGHQMQVSATRTKSPATPTESTSHVSPPVTAELDAAALPDAPDTGLQALRTQQAPAPPPCPADAAISPGGPEPTGSNAPPPLCVQPRKFSSVLNAAESAPLSSKQKGALAVREVVDPFNLITLAGQAALTVAVDSHTAYGPGFKGFGRLTGYALLGDATGAFFGVYAIPSLAHEDPRYHRMEHASIPHRILHAVAHTVIAEADDGHSMPNYATLATYPITAEIANLYVPGVQGNGPSTARRIALGFATDPISNVVSEFLPDIARHIHLRSVFFQQIINQVALGTGPGQAP